MKTTAKLLVVFLQLTLILLFYWTLVQQDAWLRSLKQVYAEREIKCIKPSNVFRRTTSGWNHKDQICQICHTFLQATMKTPFGNTPIFIYDPLNDVEISADLLRTGKFEAEENEGINAILQSDSKIDFIDIGANIGVHTLAIAKMGRKVLCVEALFLNVQRLCASVSAGGFEENVTIVYNAISDNHTRVKLGVDKTNMGGTFVDVDSAHTKELKLGRAIGTSYGEVDTITMDDLVNIPVFQQFSKVVIKMDIEGFEHRAVSKSTKFFQSLDVRGFLMEWFFHKNRESGSQIINKMTELGFEPYSLGKVKAERLAVELSGDWPENVLWRPKLK